VSVQGRDGQRVSDYSNDLTELDALGNSNIQGLQCEISSWGITNEFIKRAILCNKLIVENASSHMSVYVLDILL
jgi:hypothetical protein